VDDSVVETLRGGDHAGVGLREGNDGDATLLPLLRHLAGYPERPADWARREFLPARKRSGLRDSLRLHDLRHCAVSRLIEQGANVLLVSRVAGHARASVTLDVYAHLFRDGLAGPPNGSTHLPAVDER